MKIQYHSQVCIVLIQTIKQVTIEFGHPLDSFMIGAHLKEGLREIKCVSILNAL